MTSLKVVQGSLVSFSYKELQIITRNFSEKLGRGSFGSVFKGSLPDSSSVAVKKLEGLKQGEKQFQAEVSTIGAIQHINLIHLHGFCSQGMNRMLVYDYMPNSSLDTHLFEKNSETVDWNIRYQIALGTARGLAYLHEKCRECIIHCDIKPENVLLDAAFSPKVADFGMAKLIGREYSSVLTSIRGTIGYLAPEWISGVAITSKVDVYSFGMMLFEIISGKRNSEKLGDGESAFFPCWAVGKIAEGEVLALLDYRLDGNANMEELMRASRVAYWCIQDDENDRPAMGNVVQILEGLIDGSLVSFSYRELQIITKNFSEKLGRRSFGSVFKGSLPDSTSVAVKKLEGLKQGEKQFRAEVSTIGAIQHINLIRLHGFCSQGMNRMLVYDYMPNSSLDTHLFEKNSETVDWNIRYQIALGTARGLAYLHEKCRECIIHCDIKPENVLLDAAFCPKVADFGMAKLIGREYNRVLTSIRGTIGYLAPEWISGVAITSKADVYSFGMMLFEIISGKRNSEKLGDGESAFFPVGLWEK
ncbi:hypothetical protein AAC387_Pa06g3077 [Persea americana]